MGCTVSIDKTGCIVISSKMQKKPIHAIFNYGILLEYIAKFLDERARVNYIIAIGSSSIVRKKQLKFNLCSCCMNFKRIFNNFIFKLNTNASCNNKFHELLKLPNSLTHLTFGSNFNRKIEASVLPNSLQKLYCSYNELKELPKLPNSLQILYCEYNELKELPKLPNSLHTLYF